MVWPSCRVYLRDNGQYSINTVKNNTSEAYTSDGVRIGPLLCLLRPPSCHVSTMCHHFALLSFWRCSSLIHSVEVYSTLLQKSIKLSYQSMGSILICSECMPHDISSTSIPNRSNSDQISHLSRARNKVLGAWFGPRAAYICVTTVNIASTQSRTISAKPTLVMA